MIDKRVKEELSGQLKEGLLTGTCLREGGGNVQCGNVQCAQYFRKFEKFYTFAYYQNNGII